MNAGAAANPILHKMRPDQRCQSDFYQNTGDAEPDQHRIEIVKDFRLIDLLKQAERNQQLEAQIRRLVCELPGNCAALHKQKTAAPIRNSGSTLLRLNRILSIKDHLTEN